MLYRRPNKLREFLMMIPIVGWFGSLMPLEIDEAVPKRCVDFSVEGQRLRLDLSNVVIDERARLALEFEAKIAR